MTIKESLTVSLKEAMRTGDDVRKRALRTVLSAIKLAEVEKAGELDESAIATVIQKEVKSRRETIEDAIRAERPDLIAEAEQEITILEAFLPRPLSESELLDRVRKAIEQVQAESLADIGHVMRVLMPEVRGRADGSEVNRLVRKVLTER